MAWVSIPANSNDDQYGHAPRHHGDSARDVYIAVGDDNRDNDVTHLDVHHPNAHLHPPNRNLHPSNSHIHPPDGVGDIHTPNDDWQHHRDGHTSCEDGYTPYNDIYRFAVGYPAD
eukprot:gene11688-biopygen5953